MSWFDDLWDYFFDDEEDEDDFEARYAAGEAVEGVDFFTIEEGHPAPVRDFSYEFDPNDMDDDAYRDWADAHDED